MHTCHCRLLLRSTPQRIHASRDSTLQHSLHQLTEAPQLWGRGGVEDEVNHIPA